MTLVVIMDPLGNVPIFLSLTGSAGPAAQRRLAWQSVAVAGVVIAVFAAFGQQILSFLGITVPALQVSGGLLLLLVALELLTERGEAPTSIAKVSVALVPLGTPLIAGPGAIAVTIVFARQSHGTRDALAITVALAATLVVLWLALRGSLAIVKVLRVGGIHVLTRVFGLLLSAIAVQLAADGVRAFIRTG